MGRVWVRIWIGVSLGSVMNYSEDHLDHVNLN